MKGVIAFVRWWVMGLEPNTRGVSDLIGLTPRGLFFAFEVKAPGKLKDVSDDQADFLMEVGNRNGFAMAVDSLEMVEVEFGVHLR